MRTLISNLPGRYTPTVINGKVQQMRDKATLRADAVALLQSDGPLPKKRIINGLRTVQWLVDEVLLAAEAEGQIERFRMLSQRGRMDEFWCIAGRAPVRPQRNARHEFRGEQILTAFRAVVIKNQLEVSNGDR